MRALHRSAVAWGILTTAWTGVLLADHLGFRGSRYSASGAARDVAAADFDTDGKIDFASADMLSDTVTLYRGDGSGDFTPWAVLTLSSGAGPFDIMAADVNRDAANDLLVANADNDTIEIFYGKHGAVPGEGGHLTVAARVSPRGIAAADFNRDGRIDIAVTGATCGCVVFLRNEGEIGFVETLRVGGLSQPHGVAVTDVNRDEIPDLAIASTGANTVHVLVGDGRGFTSQRYGPAPGTRAIAVLDYDRDGWLDVVSANTTTSTTQSMISVFRNDQGVLRYAAQDLQYFRAGDRRGIVVVSINGDGVPDLAVSVRNGARVEYFIGTGSGFFPGSSTEETEAIPPNAGPRGLAVADVNGDEKSDLIVANEYDRSVTVLRNISEWSTDWW
jgi:hypothetical protein